MCSKLYLNADKPPIADLQYFLDFQAHKIWAPIHNDLPLGPSPNRASSSPALHFNLMGPKLYVNTSQVVHLKLLEMSQCIYAKQILL